MPCGNSPGLPPHHPIESSQHAGASHPNAFPLQEGEGAKFWLDRSPRDPNLRAPQPLSTPLNPPSLPHDALWLASSCPAPPGHESWSKARRQVPALDMPGSPGEGKPLPSGAAASSCPAVPTRLRGASSWQEARASPSTRPHREGWGAWWRGYPALGHSLPLVPPAFVNPSPS